MADIELHWYKSVYDTDINYNSGTKQTPTKPFLVLKINQAIGGMFRLLLRV